MTETPEIRRHANGSIDLEHYARVGRALHGAAMRSAARRGATVPARLVARLAAMISRHPIRRRAGTATLIAPAE